MAPRKKKEKEHKPSPWESNYDQIVKDELEARLELVRYYRENNLNPDINYYDDPVHGPIIKKLHQKTRLGVRAAEALRKPRNLHPNVTKVKGKPLEYDYPDVDGQPMSKLFKKRYRNKMRLILRAGVRPEIASKRAIERLSKTREILKEKARIEMARRAKEAKLKHKRPTKPNSVIIYRRVKKKKRKENL